MMRVKHLARGGVIGQLFEPLVLAIAVGQIAHERETDVLEMDSDLMRSPGVEDGLDEGCSIEPFEQLVCGPGRTAHVFVHCHPFAV